MVEVEENQEAVFTCEPIIEETPRTVLQARHRVG